MLDFCSISYRLELVSYLHVGNGEEVPIEELKPGHPHLKTFDRSRKGNKDILGLVQTVQRAAEGVPCIEGSTVRGALRELARTVDPDNAGDLFGPEEISESDEVYSGLFWLYAGVAQADTAKGASDLPFWDGNTFVLTGNRGDLDLNAVEGGFLYMTECCAPGAQFEFHAVFCGSFEDLCKAAGLLLSAMARKDGFAVGSASATGVGRARLIQDSVVIEECRYNAMAKRFDKTSFRYGDLSAPVPREEERFATIELTCDGPFFIQDPYTRMNDGDPDMRELRYEAGRPVFTGKAFLQELRRRVARQEIDDFLSNDVNEFDYEGIPLDDFDRHLPPDQTPSVLTSAQRLFGVPGWGKTVRVLSVHVEAPKARHKLQGIQLDVFTQAPIDGALLDYDVPAGITVRVGLGLDVARYERVCKSNLDEDRDLLRSALTEMGQEGFEPRYGHASGAGYGWFKADVQMERFDP